MRLIEQIIRKKIELHNEFMLNRQYLRAIWQFYCVYNISLAILGEEDNKEIARIRNRLWKKLFYGKLDDKKFKKIQTFIQNDMSVVVRALNLISKQTEDMAYDMGDIDKIDTIGILSYEFPE